MFGPLANFGGMAHDPAKNFLFADAGNVGVRLSLDPLESVPTSDQTAKTVIYLVPHKHPFIPLWDGRRFVPREVPYEFSGATTQSIKRFVSCDVSVSGLDVSNTFDVYCKWDGSRLQLKIVRWAAATVRHGGVVAPYPPWLREDGLGIFRGRLVCAMAKPVPSNTDWILQPEWLYLGTGRTDAGSITTEDSAAKRFVWNHYNRVQRVLQVLEPTDSWSYTTLAWRQMRATATNQVGIVTGVAECPIRIEASAYGSVTSYVSIGEDSTTTPEASACPVLMPRTGIASLTKVPTIGYHYYAALEYGNAGVTFYGDAGIPDRILNGLRGWVWG